MANELSINMSVDYESTTAEFTAALTEFVLTQATKTFAYLEQTVAATEAALNLGNVSSLGYILVKNTDDTNTVQIRTGTGATKSVKVRPGCGACFEFGSGVTAPFVITDSGTAKIEYWLWSS